MGSRELVLVLEFKFPSVVSWTVTSLCGSLVIVFAQILSRLVAGVSCVGRLLDRAVW